jgi:hypothetical protein
MLVHYFNITAVRCSAGICFLKIAVVVRVVDGEGLKLFTGKMKMAVRNGGL